MTIINEQDCNTLKVFQLRAARATTGTELKTIANLLGLTDSFISYWEHKDSFAEIKTTNQNISIIKEFFAKHLVFFPDKHSIVLQTTLKGRRLEGLTKFQLKAARAVLRLTRQELADLLQVSAYIIPKAEQLIRRNRYIRTYPPIQSFPIRLRNFLEEKNFVFKDDFMVSFFKHKKDFSDC